MRHIGQPRKLIDLLTTIAKHLRMVDRLRHLETSSRLPFLCIGHIDMVAYMVLAGPLYDCQRSYNMTPGFKGRAGPPDDRLWLRKIRSWEN